MSQKKLIEAKKKSRKPYLTQVIIDKLDEEVVFIALNPELDGCIAQGNSIHDALENLEDNRIKYILHFINNGLEIPEPQSDSKYIIMQNELSSEMTLSSIQFENFVDLAVPWPDNDGVTLETIENQLEFV